MLGNSQTGVSMRWLQSLFVALLLLAFFQIVYYYPQMPEVMASHFDGAGVPNAWANKDGFFLLYAAILLMLVFVFLHLPKWSEKRANFGMKLPNRNYWLAPERIEQTQQFFRRQMLVLGIAHLLLAAVTIQMAIVANFDENPVLDRRIFSALVAYFIFLVIWLIHFFLHFRKPGNNA